MVEDNPNERIRARINSLGPELGPFFHHIEDDLYNLRQLWRVYDALFGTSKERVDLLNASSGLVAFLIEQAFFEKALLSLCRLTDPPCSGRDKLPNITIRRLPSLLENHPNLAGLEYLIKDALEKASFARKWRDKKIAHADLYVRQRKASLDRASRKKVVDTIDAIASVVRWVGMECIGTTLNTHPFQMGSHNEIQFLTHLFLGQQREEELKAQELELLRTGNYEDAKDVFNHPEWLVYRPPHQFNS
ncbi:hypothetical protein KZZ08_12865 [Roseovarius mucosus]|uniref:AbiU2 domain-containing protein n=1 Tax=Roseovarius mucosus TaxID=215743 RepID=UPI001C5FFE18|nr:hypothetical protein [Roseovarius mucosus]MBW4974516.1 hypothetical protein [Roseovarius mucosus]